MFSPGIDPVSTLLLLLAVLAPIAGSAVVLYFRDQRPQLRDRSALVAGIITFLAVIIVGPGALDGGVVLPWSAVAGLSQGLQMDALSFVFALAASLLWLVTIIFTPRYMSHSGGETRFLAALMLTEGTVMGVFLAADWLTLLLAFEMMTLVSYLLVIHDQTPAALAAGALYLYLSLAAGLAILLGLFMVTDITGGTAFLPLEPGAGELGIFLALPFLIGFGLKAGMVPFQIWLPRAHPVAPSPASALLSGILIKTGVYGLVRTFFHLLLPQVVAGGPGVTTMATLLLVLGFGTMYLGALQAFRQDSIKRVLAFSSVSQMGYIIVGLGAALFLGADGAMPLAGALYHVLNHALLKGGFFLAAGMVALHAHTLDFSTLQAKRLELPWVQGWFLGGLLAISGLPLLNSFSSKSLLFHGLEKAYNMTGYPLLGLGEKLFILGGALTFAYYLRLYHGIFGGAGPSFPGGKGREKGVERSVILILGLIIIAIGFLPGLILVEGLVPALTQLGFSGAKVDEYLVGFSFFSGPNLLEAAITMGLGLGIWSLLRLRRRLFHGVGLPKGVVIEKKPRGILSIVCYSTLWMETLIHRLFFPGRLFQGVPDALRTRGKKERDPSRVFHSVCRKCYHFERSLSSWYFRPGRWFMRFLLLLETVPKVLSRWFKGFLPALGEADEEGRLPSFVRSLHFAPFILAFVLVLVVLVMFIFVRL